MRPPEGFPKSVDVAGIKFKVVLSEEKAGSDNFGKMDIDERELLINPSQCKNPEHYWGTLYHEAAHACSKVSGIADLLGSKRDEALVVMIENILLPAFKKIHQRELESS